MKCAIMQPTYFPWSGYFNLIFKADIFIFLNDAQYSKGSWHSRNIIIVNNSKYTLTIPTKKSPLSTKIMSKIIDNSKNWQKRQAKIISQAYSNHPFFKDLTQLIEFFERLRFECLSDFNIEIIRFISEKLDLNANFLNSNELNLPDNRIGKIIEILNKVNATEYLSPEGSKEYLEEDKFEELTNIKLLFNKYVPKSYEQKNQNNFIENLSIIDVIANLGWINTKTYVIEN